MKTLTERFWSKVNKTDSCWEWTASGLPTGYGTLFREGHKVYAHRYSWEIHFGPIQPGIVVCHRCDNTKCVRPDHLFLGTQKDNLNDMQSKGRKHIHHPSGLKNGRAKLTPEIVQEIRYRYPLFEGSDTQFAEGYGVGRTTIKNIINNKLWKIT